MKTQKIKMFDVQQKERMSGLFTYGLDDKAKISFPQVLDVLNEQGFRIDSNNEFVKIDGEKIEKVTSFDIRIFLDKYTLEVFNQDFKDYYAQRDIIKEDLFYLMKKI